MLVKAKDVVRVAPVLVAAAQFDARVPSSPALRSKLVPCTARNRACRYLARIQDLTALTALQEMRNTPRSVVGRARMGDHNENAESL
jgi:hypothetical protein